MLQHTEQREKREERREKREERDAVTVKPLLLQNLKRQKNLFKIQVSQLTASCQTQPPRTHCGKHMITTLGSKVFLLDVRESRNECP